MSMTSNTSTMNYQIALCEIFNQNIHGFNEDSSEDMNQRILASYTFSREEFMDKNEWMPMIANMRTAYSHYSPYVKNHPSIRNYKNIVDNPDYYKLDIVQVEEMPGGEACAIIKTGGIKRFQRLWKKHLKHQRKLLQERSKPENLRQRELTGKWPTSCSK